MDGTGAKSKAVQRGLGFVSFFGVYWDRCTIIHCETYDVRLGLSLAAYVEPLRHQILDILISQSRYHLVRRSRSHILSHY